MTGLSKLLFHNEEFIPEVSEDSSTVHVGTAMFCQVGSEVCLHFEVNLSRIYFIFYLFGSEIFSANKVLFKPDFLWLTQMAQKH